MSFMVISICLSVTGRDDHYHWCCECTEGWKVQSSLEIVCGNGGMGLGLWTVCTDFCQTLLNVNLW